MLVLEQLPPTGIALLSAVDRRLRAAVRSLEGVVKKARGERIDAHLRIVHRKQECGSLLHESWDGDWQQRWALGPSRPPPDRPAYRSLDARDATHPDALSLQGDLEAMGLTPVRGDEGQPRSLKLHPGCARADHRGRRQHDQAAERARSPRAAAAAGATAAPRT